MGQRHEIKGFAGHSFAEDLNPYHQMALKPMKSQLSSTKLQINLKIQYSMTQTLATTALHRFDNRPDGNSVSGSSCGRCAGVDFLIWVIGIY